MRFTKLSVGQGSSMAQIIEGDFALVDVPVDDSERTVPMFVGVRSRRSYDVDSKHRSESRIAIPVGSVTFAEIAELEAE